MRRLKTLIAFIGLAFALCTHAAPRVPSASEVMDWAQTAYPQFFPGRKGDIDSPPYLYRYYPETQNHIGVAADAIYILGPVSGGKLQKVGALADFSCSVYPETCSNAAADQRNGSYAAYATNGERFTLTLDFAAGVYTWEGLTRPDYASSGAIAPDTVEGTWVFSGAGITAKFRYVDDLVVGSYNFGGTTTPFVAGRRFALSLSEAAGIYNNLGVSKTTTNVADSTIYASRITAQGQLSICASDIIYAMDQCPATLQQVYALTVDNGVFRATPLLSSTGDAFNFRVLKSGNSLVYLMAAIATGTGRRVFRIGVPESANFPAGKAYGGSTSGEWGVANYTANSYSSTGVALDGHAISLTGTLSTVGITGPTGLRSLKAVGSAFVLRSDALGILVGARNGPAAGYMQLGAR